jgi:ATP-binding cassette subfamily B protein
VWLARLPWPDGLRSAASLYTYDAQPVLQDINVTVEPGQTAAIVGPTGSGKSTLLQAAVRLIDPPPGTVRIDGVDVRDLPLSTLAPHGLGRATGAVPVLGHDRSQHRVCAGDRFAAAEARRAAVERAAADARLDKDLADFPKATTRWWASAASRCRADRSSARARSRRWSRSARADSGRRPVGGGYLHGEEILERLRRVRQGARASSWRTASPRPRRGSHLV